MPCQRCSVCGINWPMGTRDCEGCGGATWYSPSNEPDDTATLEGVASAKPRIKGAVECGACGHEVSGYSKQDLGKMGWQWHSDADRVFVMCGDCEVKYADRRMERALAAGVR